MVKSDHLMMKAYYGLPQNRGEIWYGRYVLRRISVPLSVFLYRNTRLSADSLTVASGVCGFLAAVLLSQPSFPLMLLAGVFLHLWLILDGMDGEVARLRDSASERGKRLDRLMHYLVNPLILPALLIACNDKYRLRGGLQIVLGAVAVSCFLVALDDVEGRLANSSGRDRPFRRFVHYVASASDIGAQTIAVTALGLIGCFWRVSWLVVWALGLFILFRDCARAFISVRRWWRS